MKKNTLQKSLIITFIPLVGLTPLTPSAELIQLFPPHETSHLYQDLVLDETLPYDPVTAPLSLKTEETDKVEITQKTTQPGNTKVIAAPLTPTPLEPVPAPEHLNTLFETYAAANNIDKNLLVHISKCESGHNPNAGNGLYGGMFQFAAGTWSSTRTDMGLDPDPSLRFHAEESIKTAAWKIAHGGQNAWKNCLPR